MAQGSYSKRNVRTAFGARRAFYVRTETAGLWIVQASANTQAELAAAIGRAQARKPGAAIRVTDSTGAVVSETAAALAA